jgi:uncharacterized protein YhbP (UPF0306 family)
VEAIAELLRSQSTLALATVAEDGAARVTPLFYLVDEDLRLYWFSSRASEHSKSLRKNPDVAVTVYRPTERWREIRGVQMRGVAAAVGDRARRRAIAEAYAERFGLGKALRAGMARCGLYTFEPRWARYIDNSRGLEGGFEVWISGEGTFDAETLGR